MAYPNDDTSNNNSQQNKKNKTGKVLVKKDEKEGLRGVNDFEEISTLQPIGPVSINSPQMTNSIGDTYKGNNTFDGTILNKVSIEKPKVENKPEGRLETDPTVTNTVINQAKNKIVLKKDKIKENTKEVVSGTTTGPTVTVKKEEGKEEQKKKMVTTPPEKTKTVENKKDENVLSPPPLDDSEVVPKTVDNNDVIQTNTPPPPLVEDIAPVTDEQEVVDTVTEEVSVDTNETPDVPDSEGDGSSDGEGDINDFKELMGAVTGTYLDAALNENSKATTELTGEEMEPKDLYETREGIKEGWSANILEKENRLREGISGLSKEGGENQDSGILGTVDLGEGEEAMITKGDQVLEMEDDNEEKEDIDDDGTVLDVLSTAELPGFDLEAEKEKEKNRVQQYEDNKAAEKQFLEQRAGEIAAKRNEVLKRRELKEKERAEEKHKRDFAEAIRRGARIKEMAFLKEQRKRDANERMERVRKNKEFADAQVAKIMADADAKHADAKHKLEEFMDKLPELIEANKSKNQELLNSILKPKQSTEGTTEKKDDTDGKLKNRMSAIDTFIAEKRAKAKALIAEKKAAAEKMVQEAIAEAKEKNGGAQPDKDKGTKVEEIAKTIEVKKDVAKPAVKKDSKTPEKKTPPKHEEVGKNPPKKEVATGTLKNEDKDKTKTDGDDEFASLDITTTKEEDTMLTAKEKNEKAGHKRGLMVGRSVGYGMKITFKEKKTPEEKETFDVSKFSEDGASEEDAKVTYMNKNMRSAEEKDKLQPGYHTGYCRGYNEGQREGKMLKKDAENAQGAAQLAEEQKTDEYKAGALLGLASGVASASRKREVEAAFMFKKGEESVTVNVKAPLNDVRTAAFDQKQTPGGELSGPVYEKAFLQNYNMGYQQAKAKQRQGPEIDEDYKTGYEPGYKLGVQKANGEHGDQELIDLRKQYEGVQAKDLEKSEKQKSLGFFAGYNNGHKQVKEKAKNAVQAAQEKKYKDPSFMAGFATGNMKGFLTAIIASSGIDLLTALNDPNKMEAAGIPDYFPIPELIKENIKATLIQGDVQADENTTDAIKALLGKPLFKEGLLMGYNQGYSRGQKSKLTFQQDKIRLHPDYQAGLQFVKGRKDNVGQLMAEARHKINQIQAKSNLSAEDEAEIKTLASGISALQAEVDKKSSFYQRAVLDCYNQRLSEKKKEKFTAKQTIKNQDVWNEGNGLGAKVGEKVVEGKEKLKNLHANGLDITARRAGFNKAIQNFHKKAKVKAKKDGEDYYNGYIEGYNAALIASKEAKKSDMGNKKLGEGFSDAERKMKNDEKSKLETDIEGALTDYLANPREINLKKGKEACKNAGRTKKAFEDGAAQGYNLAYSTRLINPETRKIKGGDSAIDEQYKKHIRSKETEFVKLESGSKEDRLENNEKWGLLFYYMMGYQYLGKGESISNVPYGVPKGFKDADSYNRGFEKARADHEKGGDEEQEESTDSYKAGYEAAKYRIRYESFKDKMIDTAMIDAESKKAPKEVEPSGDGKTDAPPKATSKEEDPMKKLTYLKKSAKKIVEEEEHNEDYDKGFSDAEGLWTKIVYVGGKVNLGVVDIKDSLDDKITITDGLEIDSAGLESKENGIALAQTYLKDREKYIDGFAEQHKIAAEKKDKEEKEKKEKDEAKSQKKKNKNSLDGGIEKDKEKEKEEETTGFWGGLMGLVWKGVDWIKYQGIKASYREGYSAKIEEIEKGYKKKLMEKWLKDLGFAMGAKAAAQDAMDVKIPEAPYHGMSVEDADKNDPLYQEGHFEGMQFGTKVKSGLVNPKESELAGMKGGHYKRGFDDGLQLAKVMGPQAAKEPTKTSPTDMDLLASLDEKAKKNEGKKSEDITNEDYKKGYVKGFSTRYWQIRDYEYGKRLGYQRASSDDSFNTEPEDNVEIGDETAFFNGFNEGREAAMLGLSEDVLTDGREVIDTPEELIKSLVMQFAWHNAAVKAVDELGITPKIGTIVEGTDSYYKDYSELQAIEYLRKEKDEGNKNGLSGDIEGIDLNIIETDNILTKDVFTNAFREQLRIDMATVDNLEKAEYKALFDELYKDVYNNAYMQCLVDLTDLAMIVALDGRTDEKKPSVGNPALDALVEILFDDSVTATGEGGDFMIDKMALLEVFHQMEAKIEDTEYEIEDDLDEIEFYQIEVESIETEEFLADEERIATLEEELKDKSLKPKDRAPKLKELRVLKKKLKQQQHYLKGARADWVRAETAAKEKIETIRLFMNERLGFDTPLKSNEDILEYIKINLQTSEEGGDVYEDIDVFNNLILDGTFNYSESADIQASIGGSGTLKINEYAEDVDIRTDVFIQKNGFEFKAKGLDYRESREVLYLVSGILITPKIEGGEHVGEQYRYTFDDFSIMEGRGIKGQIEDQLYTLKGGEM